MNARLALATVTEGPAWHTYPSFTPTGDLMFTTRFEEQPPYIEIMPR